jgi:hypothetical protein
MTVGLDSRVLSVDSQRADAEGAGAIGAVIVMIVSIIPHLGAVLSV